MTSRRKPSRSIRPTSTPGALKPLHETVTRWAISSAEQSAAASARDRSPRGEFGGLGFVTLHARSRRRAAVAGLVATGKNDCVAGWPFDDESTSTLCRVRIVRVLVERRQRRGQLRVVPAGLERQPRRVLLGDRLPRAPPCRRPEFECS